MTQAERIVAVLLQEEDAEEFMRDVEFGPQGRMIILHDLDLIKDELSELSQAVVRRTAEIAPKLVERGIIEPTQTQILAKLLTFYLADQQYNPKHWHEKWQRAARRIYRWLPGNVNWTGGMSRLNSDINGGLV